MTNGKIFAIVLAACGVLGLLTVASCAGVLYLTYRSANDSASPAIDRLFAAIDNGTFDETYETATTPEFRKVTSKQQYSLIGKAISTRLGRLKSKTMRSFNVRQVNADSLIDVTYAATFENGNGTIAAKLKREGSEWKLLSFQVNSPQFQQDVATAKCAKCGAPHTADAKFCPSCGAPIAPPERAEADDKAEN